LVSSELRLLIKMKFISFEQAFEQGKDISKYLDLGAARRLNLEKKRVHLDLPAWMVQQLDKEAKRLGVTRQSIIKMWLAERLKEKM